MMMIELSVEYLATGANKHPATADWDEQGVLAFGTDRNLALWRPKVRADELELKSLSLTSTCICALLLPTFYR